MAENGDRIADAVGVKFDKLTADVFEKPTIAGPLGLRIDTQWRFSHGTQQETYLVVCWKVCGDLYVMAAHEPDGHQTTVALLDKARWSAKQEDPKTFLATAATAADKAGVFETLDGYIGFWGDAIVGVWSRKMGDKGWTKLDV